MRTVEHNPQTSSKDLQHEPTADGIPVHLSTTYRAKKKNFSAHMPHTKSIEVRKNILKKASLIIESFEYKKGYTLHGGWRKQHSKSNYYYQQ